MLNEIIILVLSCFSIHYAFSEDNIFEWLGNYVKNRYLRKVLFDCVGCMPSLYGTIFYFLVFRYDFSVTKYIILILCSSGLAFIVKIFINFIFSLTELILKYIDKYEQDADV